MRTKSAYLFALAAVLVALTAAAPASAGPTASASASLFGQAGVSSSQGRSVGAAAAGKRLDLSLLLRADDAGLTRYATAVSNPESSLFGRHLSQSEVARRFGPSAADRGRVIGWLRSRGLQAAVAPGGFSIDTSATVAQAQRLFSTRIGAFRSSAGERFVAPVSRSSLPAELKGAVVGVDGLSDRTVAHGSSSAAKAAQLPPGGLQPLTPEQSRAVNYRMRAVGSSIRGNLGTQAGCAAGRANGLQVSDQQYIPAYTPNQYLDAYGISRLHDRGFRGQGQRVALVEIDGFTRSDLTAAAACFGFRAPPTTIKRIGIKRNLPPGPENTLDLQVLAAVAPGLKEIIVFQGAATSYGLNRQYASAVALPASRRPTVISSSIGSCEINEYGGGPYHRALGRTFKQAAAVGITVAVATGDTGSTGCSAGGGNSAAIALPSTGYPASSPWVVGVGGTNFTLDSRNRITEEVVWNQAPISFGAGTGGPSLIFRQPSWQRGPGVGTNTGARATPDIAMLADNTPGYSIYCTALECGGAGWITVGGTSAAAPLFSGILAIANQQAKRAGQPRLGHINPRIYRLAGQKSTRSAVFRDVTKVGNDLGVLIGPQYLGTNQPVGCCPATRYYDWASGWGSVKAPQFSRELR